MPSGEFLGILYPLVVSGAFAAGGGEHFGPFWTCRAPFGHKDTFQGIPLIGADGKSVEPAKGGKEGQLYPATSALTKFRISSKVILIGN